MPDPGDVVTVDFVGATGIKRRPAVVVSSRLYHQHRPDLILGVLTTDWLSGKLTVRQGKGTRDERMRHRTARGKWATYGTHLMTD